MRDLGLMGESTFTLWCAEAGLIPNGSQVDKTGWDFFVEFPFNADTTTREIHTSALECKVQVKATDYTKRKLSIKLSNLRRLITAQMPSFLIFLEFDGKDSAQRAFLVHVDNALITKVLKRLHQIGQSNEEAKFNKRTFTIQYDDSHLINELNGVTLKRKIEQYIGDDLASYISSKKEHLESTGFENGFGQMTFSMESEEDLKALIDVSLGIEKRVNISKIRGTNTRFGILNRTPFANADRGLLEMPNLKPFAVGKIKFKEDKLSAGLSFDAKLYNSPFNKLVAKDFVKMRLEGEFFDLVFNPYTGASKYSFSFGEGIRLEINKFRDALKLLQLLGSSGKQLFSELWFDEFPKLDFSVGCTVQDFDYSHESRVLDCASKLLTEFEITDTVDISLDEIITHGLDICNFYKILDLSPGLLKVEFDIDNGSYNHRDKTACIFTASATVGSHNLGAIIVLFGDAQKIEDNRFSLIADSFVIERKIVSVKDKDIPRADLLEAIEIIENKYDSEFSVVSLLK